MSHKPRIAWFTPFTRKSSIGSFSRVVTKELESYAEVDLWLPKDSDFDLASGPFISLPDVPSLMADHLASYDLLVYNMGDHYPNHGQIFEYLQRFPGVLILHDLVLHDFFVGHFFSNTPDQAGYLNLMQGVYGNQGRRFAEMAFEGKGPAPTDIRHISDFPLFEPAVERANGVVVHSEWAQRKVASHWPGPLQKLFLAFDYKTLEPRRTEFARRKPGKILMASIGHVNPNRRITSVLELLGKNPDLAEKIDYVIAGEPSPIYFQECQSVIERYRLESIVRWSGYLDDDELRAVLTEADFCVNLRFPPMESGSGSLAEQMFAGKMAIVSDAGCFRDVPDSCVLKIDPHQEQSSLESALRFAVSNPGAWRQIGDNARQFAQERYSPDAYAKALIPFLEQIRNLTPLTASLGHIGAQLRSMGARPDMPIYRTVANTFHELFCSGPSRFSPRPGATPPSSSPEAVVEERSVPPVIFFLHIPKTAGMSLHKIVASQYKPEEMMDVYAGELDFWPPNTQVIRDLRRPNSGVKMFYGHYGFGVHLLLGLPDARYITMMRHPVKRIVSFYQHQAREPNSRLYRFISEGRTLRELIEERRAPEFNNYVTRILATDAELIQRHVGSNGDLTQLTERLADLKRSFLYLAGIDGSPEPCDQIYHRSHLEAALRHIRESFLFVGITERFDDSLKILAYGLEWKTDIPKSPYVNRSPLAPLPVDQATFDTIRAYNALDFELYDRFSDLSFRNFGPSRNVND